jgi:hypothetical protein
MSSRLYVIHTDRVTVHRDGTESAYGIRAVCFADVRKDFHIQSFVTPKEAEKYLSYVRDETEKSFDFERSDKMDPSMGWNVVLNKSGEHKPKHPAYYVKFKKDSKVDRVIVGNLIKGICEHKDFCIPILKNKDKNFFDVSYEAFLKLLELPERDFAKASPYGTCHHWWHYMGRYPEAGYQIVMGKRGSTKTINEAYHRAHADLSKQFPQGAEPYNSLWAKALKHSQYADLNY